MIREQPSPSAPLRKISCQLGGPLKAIRGIQWARYQDGRLFERCAYEAPAEVAVTLPSGKTVTLWSRLTFFSQSESMVTEVDLHPLANAVDYYDAVSEVERIGLFIGLDRDELFTRTLTDWKNRPPVPGKPPPTRGTGGLVEKDCDVRIAMKQNSEERWFIVLELRMPL